MRRSTGSAMSSAGQGMMDTIHPRWYWHPYNRVGLYRLAELFGRAPRRLRLLLARQLGQLAPRFLPAEREAVRGTLVAVTGASGARLDELTTDVFRDFAMCFSDLISTNRQAGERLLRYVRSVSGVDQVAGLSGGIVSVTAHVGNWDLAGRLLATQ